MEIYVVQPGDNINTIADTHGVSVSKLIQDNELENPNNLVPGQTIVIVYPEQTHTVQEGDNLSKIANLHGVTVMEILRNNPFLSGRKSIYPGEILTVRYNTGKKIKTNGYVYPFINKSILIKTLPSLTTVSIFNYRVTVEGDVNAFYDDTEIIQLSKMYGVVPLMQISTLSSQGDMSPETVYQILLNDKAQDRYIDNMLAIMQAKGYYGVNITFSFLNAITQKYYESFLTKITNRLKQAGFLVFVTISPASKIYNGTVFEEIDYSKIGKMVDNLSFIHFIWGTNSNPPSPVCSYSEMKNFLDYVIKSVTPDKIDIGIPIIGYDWELPFIDGRTIARSITLNAVLDIASESGVSIQFDDYSQTPNFEYNQFNLGTLSEHVIWFVDARSIGALVDLFSEYELAGIGIWTLMVYFPQLWLIINAELEVEKLIS